MPCQHPGCFRSDHGLPFTPLAHMTTAAAVGDPEDAPDEDFCECFAGIGQPVSPSLK